MSEELWKNKAGKMERRVTLFNSGQKSYSDKVTYQRNLRKMGRNTQVVETARIIKALK